MADVARIRIKAFEKKLITHKLDGFVKVRENSSQKVGGSNPSSGQASWNLCWLLNCLTSLYDVTNTACSRRTRTKVVSPKINKTFELLTAHSMFFSSY